MAERAKVQRTLGKGDGGKVKRVDMRAVEERVDGDEEVETIEATSGSMKRKGKKRPAVASEDSEEDGTEEEGQEEG
ncbi:hypothetical protein LTS01_025430 [Friedmanniomyces endolithicus]|nr:hypothetical protein LTS01_025430 [Friedmanniomyces endolithicus]